MAPAGDHILLVENDPEISDLIARQTLRSVGYQVDVVSDVSSADQISVQTPPDLIIADLNLPGLSAKDMLIALSSQGVMPPSWLWPRKDRSTILSRRSAWAPQITFCGRRGCRGSSSACGTLSSAGSMSCVTASGSI